MATTKRPWHFLYFARFYMALRECWVKDRRREAQEEVVADLHSCLEQLTYRCTEMETKIQNCKQRALYHMQLAKKESGQVAIQREQTRARMFMQDRKRLMVEYDKATRSLHMLQQQIDSIVSSHVDMVVVDAMRGFNATAARMALPQKATEIEKLSQSLEERHTEALTLHEAMGGIWQHMDGPQDDTSSELMTELENLLMEDEDIAQPTASPPIPNENIPLLIPSPPSTSKLPSPPPAVVVPPPIPHEPAPKPLIVEISSTPLPA